MQEQGQNFLGGKLHVFGSYAMLDSAVSIDINMISLS